MNFIWTIIFLNTEFQSVATERYFMIKKNFLFLIQSFVMLLS